MDDKIKLILHNVQQSASCHQKYLKILENHYQKIPFEDFIKDFFKYLRHIFHMDIAIRNPYVERTLEFLAQFVSVLTKPNETESQISLDEDSPSHPFLTQVINETLRFHDLAYVQTRYYSCRFITLILQHIGYETHLDNDICDSIQESMLERILDPKASIRLQAVMALVRLQEPLNPDCPVIKAYLSLLIDANPLIRKEVVKRIAPNAITIPKISERIRDVDYHVRIAAYTRCADIGPKLFKIIVRQQILKCGFHDNNKHVKLVFMENLLPKWLSAYNGDFLAFLSALKLDADENDIVNTEEISKKVMEVFFRNVPIKEIIDALPVDNDKLIPLNNLTSEVITYWNIVTNYLRSSDETEEYLDNTLPELTPFCNYIQSIIDSKTSKKMEEWEYLDYQYILYNLFDMAEQYDLGDEVGRRTFHKLVMSILQNHKLQFKLAKKVISIADKLISGIDVLSNEICQIISDIREPLVDKPAEKDENTNNSFQIAELKVKINILQGDIEDALDSKDFQKASVIQNEIIEYKRKLEDLDKQNQVVKVKVSKDDPETICRCLDLLSALLELPSVNYLSPSLATCRSEFLLPLLTSDIVEVNWRVLKCLALFCVFDKSLAEEHTKVLCIPIATYRAIPNYNKCAVMESVAAICDLMRIHGSELFGSEEDTNNTGSQHNTTRRRLYRNEDMDDVTVMDHNRMNVEFIIEIILDMLDDENEEIRETAITGISKLILTDFPVSPLLISRIILKWFNPLTEKAGDRIQQKLGSLISNYTKVIKGAREIIGKAVIPTLTSIASAPRTSPLADVDIENVARFLAAITNSNETTDIVHIHTNLAHTLYYKVASKPKDPIVPYLTKMLLYLEIPADNSAVIKELITEFELLLEEEEDGLDKGPRKAVTKFVEKLKASLINGTIEESLGDVQNTIQQTDNTNTETDVTNAVETTENNQTDNTRKTIEGSENDKSEESSNSIDERIQKLVENEKENLQTVANHKIGKGNEEEIEVGGCNGMEKDTNSDKVRRPKRTRQNKTDMAKNKINQKQTREKDINLIETDSSSSEEVKSKRQRVHSNSFDSTEKTTKTNDDNSTAEENTPPRQTRQLRQTDPCKNNVKAINLRKNKNLKSVDKVIGATGDRSTEADSDSTAGENTPPRQRRSLRLPGPSDDKIKEINLRKNKNLDSVNKAIGAKGDNTAKRDSDSTAGENTPPQQRRSLRQPGPSENKIKEVNLRKNKNHNSVDKVMHITGENTTETDSDNATGEKSPPQQRRSLRHPGPNENKTKEVNLRKNKNLNSVDRVTNGTGDNTTEADSDSTIGEKPSQRQRGENNNKQISSKNLRNNKNPNSDAKSINAKNKNAPEQKRRILSRKRGIEKTTNKNIINGTDTTGDESEGKNKMRRTFKRTRRGVSKPVGVTRKGTKNEKKSQNNNHTISRKDKIDDDESDTTTDREVDSENNRGMRRSKRPRTSLEISDTSMGSKESEKENKSKNAKNQSVSNFGISETNNRYNVQTRRSTGHSMTQTNLTINNSFRQPVAESTNNNVHMTLRKSTTKGPTEKNCEVNGIKRRKSRGKKSLDLDSTGDTTLHTIIEQSERVSNLDDTSFQTPNSNSSPQKGLRSRNSSVFSTPTSTISRRSKSIISETSSDSESGSTISSIRRSARKIKKKNMDNYVL